MVLQLETRFLFQIHQQKKHLSKFKPRTYFDEKMEKLKETIARKSEERRAKDERIDDMVAKLYATRMGRTSCALQLIELEMFDGATQVLEGLLDEDDEVVET